MGVHVRYLDETFNEYGEALDRAKSLDDLREVVTQYRRFAYDAVRLVAKMKANEWPAFKKGLRLERKGKFAGEDFAKKYGAVLMPEVMFKVGMIAHQFHVPWGCAFLHAKDLGKIVECDGIAKFSEEAT